MTEHNFGGGWTEQKLSVVREYAQLYTAALRNKFERLMYIDAFAGTGSRLGSSPGIADVGRTLMTPGSAQLALDCSPGFDEFVFIERKRSHVAALERLKEEHPDKANAITVHRADANVKLQEVCQQTDWGWRRRALAFLDPYGMQVRWTTLETVAATEGIDLWLLFPSGIGVNRLLMRSGRIPAQWEIALDGLFGASTWRDAFYAPSPQGDLFLDEALIKEANVDTIEQEYLDRLRTIFPKVLNRTLRLRNKTNSVMYSLVFCCSNPNPKASGLALKFADFAIRKSNG